MIVLCLPIPVSANRYWATRVVRDRATGKPRAMMYVTPEAKAYREEVQRVAREAGVREPIAGRVELAYRLFPHRPLDYRTRMRKLGAAWDDTVRCIDLGNCEKVLSDALQGTVIGDDVWVWKLTGVRMEPDDDGARLVVYVRPLPEPARQVAIPLETTA